MTAGFQAFTDTGLFQIDGQTPNYQLTTVLNHQLTSDILPTVYNDVGHQYSAGFWHTTFTFTGNKPLFAFRADGNVLVAPWKFGAPGPSTFTAEFIGAGQTNVQLYVFDQVLPGNSHEGLQVFDTSGALIADAASPFAKVIDVVSGQYLGGAGWDASGTSMPPPNTQSANYGVPVAIAACWPAHYAFGTGGSIDGETTMTGVAVSGGQVTWEFHTFAGSRGPHFIGYRESTYYRFMVLDMSGII
jgi:hypothetical protein